MIELYQDRLLDVVCKNLINHIDSAPGRVEYTLDEKYWRLF